MEGLASFSGLTNIKGCSWGQGGGASSLLPSFHWVLTWVTLRRKLPHLLKNWQALSLHSQLHCRMNNLLHLFQECYRLWANMGGNMFPFFFFFSFPTGQICGQQNRTLFVKGPDNLICSSNHPMPRKTEVFIFKPPKKIVLKLIYYECI